jgi:hypothetical protein
MNEPLDALAWTFEEWTDLATRETEHDFALEDGRDGMVQAADLGGGHDLAAPEHFVPRWWPAPAAD